MALKGWLVNKAEHTPKKILITGSEGSLGGAIIRELLKTSEEYDIFGIDNLYKSQSLSPLADRQYRFFYADLSETSQIESLQLNHEFDYIIHCAAKIYGVGGFNKHAQEIICDDPVVTSNTLTCFRSRKFIYISSSMVYESFADGAALLEDWVDHYPPPKTEYGLSKYVGERMTKSFCKAYNFPYTIWRPFNIITPHERADATVGNAHVFADFLDALVVSRSPTLPILGDGKQIRCFTDIDDVAECIVRFLDDPATDNRTFNVGRNDQPVTMNELATLIANIAYNHSMRASKSFDSHFLPAYTNDVRKRIPDLTRIKNELKWTAPTPLEKSITKCVLELKNELECPCEDCTCEK